MTWLRGTTTFGNLDHLLTQLICGEVADDFSTVVTSGSRWLRDSPSNRTVTDASTTNGSANLGSASASFTSADLGALVIVPGVALGTTISSITSSTVAVMSANATATASGLSLQITTNAIRTPASVDVPSGNCSNRTGYFVNLGNGQGPSQPTSTGVNSVCKVTAPYTSAPSTTYAIKGRWALTVSVYRANTVAGDYSTAQIAVQLTDLDLPTTTGSFGFNVGLSLNSAGVYSFGSLYSAYGLNGLTVQLSDPSGILPVNTGFVRGFTSTYLYGVDAWPMWYRSSTGTPTFATAPPGSAGTDYDVVSIPYSYTTGIGTSIGAYSVSLYDTGLLLSGLGIKTATGLGSLYTVSHPMALAKARIFASASASGVLSLDCGSVRRDTLATPVTHRNMGGSRIATWAQAFTTPASVSSSSLVQYWMSVSATGIVLVVNGDPGNTGKLGTAYLCSFSPTDTVYDVFPMMVNQSVMDYTSDNSGEGARTGVQYEYWTQRRRQDGSETSASRDCQTKWMRGEHWSLSSVTAGVALANMGSVGNSSATNNYTASPASQAKPAPDGKWWLYGAQWAQSQLNSTVPWPSGSVDDVHFIRGTQSARWYYIPETGWNSGDELVDSVSGTKYLLLKPDYAALGHWRYRYTTNAYLGGVAIAET